MMRILLFTLLGFSMVSIVGCSKSETADVALANTETGFINRVWQVSDSQAVAEGTLYVFLSEGTLVITSANSTPAIGSWEKTSTGLRVTEGGITYVVDTESTHDHLLLTYHSPAGETGIMLTPAK